MICPITSSDIFAALTDGQFRPFTRDDEMTFAGVEYSGYTWTPEVPGYTKGEIIVVLDRGPGSMHVQVVRSMMDGNNQVWASDIMIPVRWKRVG